MKLTDNECVQLNQALFSLTHAYEARLAREKTQGPNSLTVYDCAVLMVLGQFTPINSRLLAQRMQVTPSTISVYIRRLSKKGLVRMERAENDRRNGWLHLTSPGEKIYRTILAGTASYTRDFVSALDTDEQRVLHRLLLKVSHSLGFTWQ